MALLMRLNLWCVMKTLLVCRVKSPHPTNSMERLPIAVFKPADGEVDGVSDQVSQLVGDAGHNGVVHPDMPMDTHPNDILLGYPGAGSEVLTNSSAIPGDTHIPGDMYRPTNFDRDSSTDALVQQVYGTIGYEMQAGMGISPDAKGNTTGTIAAYNVMGSGVPVENHCTGYCFDGGSSGKGHLWSTCSGVITTSDWN